MLRGKNFLIFCFCNCAIWIGNPGFAAERTAASEVQMMAQSLERNTVVSVKVVAVSKSSLFRFAMAPDQLERNASRKFWFSARNNRDLCRTLASALAQAKLVPAKGPVEPISMSVILYGVDYREIGTIYLSERGSFGLVGAMPFLIESKDDTKPLLDWFVHTCVWSD